MVNGPTARGLVGYRRWMGTLAEGWSAAALGAFVLSLALAAWWTQTGRLRVTGDEPHYLIISASVARDADLDVRNNYEADFRAPEIYGPVDVHAEQTPEAWWPLHTPGLGVLMAAPWALGGVLGARLAMYLMVLPLLALGVWGWLREGLPPAATGLAVTGMVGSVPVIFGGSQIYPDLPCGVIVLSLLAWVWGPSRGNVPAWCAYWLIAGLLPWLHTKYFAASVLLAAAGAWRAWRDRRRVAALLPGLLFFVGTGSLVWWHLRTFGGVLGWRRLEHLALDPLRILEIFLGLHLDQAQGLFLQQPLLLPGLVGLGHMLSRRHPLTLPWLLLYCSLIVPNAMEVNSYGGGGPSGRFAWTAMWLWIVPLGIWLRDARSTVEPYVRPVVLLALVYQAFLAVRWGPTPTALFPYYSELVWERNSLLPVAVRYSLPSFYFWDFERYLTYLPNVVWVVGAALLLVTGYLWSAPLRRRQPGTVWLGFVVVAALVLPAEPTADAESLADRQRSVDLLQSMHRSVRSVAPQRFEAEHMLPRDLREETAVEDPQASGGGARVSQPAHSSGFVIFGPWIDLDPGRYRAEVALRLTGPAEPGTVARFSVFAAGTQALVARTSIPVERLRRDRYATFALPFESGEALDDVAFRVRVPSDLPVGIDYVDLIPVLP